MSTILGGFGEIIFLRSRDYNDIPVWLNFRCQNRDLRGRFHSRCGISFLVTTLIKNIVTFTPQVITPYAREKLS